MTTPIINAITQLAPTLTAAELPAETATDSILVGRPLRRRGSAPGCRWTASLSIAELPVQAAAANLVTAISALPAGAAYTTVFDECAAIRPSSRAMGSQTLVSRTGTASRAAGSTSVPRARAARAFRPRVNPALTTFAQLRGD